MQRLGPGLVLGAWESAGERGMWAARGRPGVTWALRVSGARVSRSPYEDPTLSFCLTCSRTSTFHTDFTGLPPPLPLRKRPTPQPETPCDHELSQWGERAYLYVGGGACLHQSGARRWVRPPRPVGALRNSWWLVSASPAALGVGSVCRSLRGPEASLCLLGLRNALLRGKERNTEPGNCPSCE